MTFHIGQKVVCVNGEFNKSWADLPVSLPQQREVYTIRALGCFNFNGSPATPVMWLFEIQNNEELWEDGSAGEVGFDVHRFRPVKETDISIFTAMLTPTPKQKVPA